MGGPGSGRRPNPERQRVAPVRRNLRSTKATVDATQAVKTPLPFEPNPMTQMWWDTIWSSPISHEWVDADVPGLLALGQLVDDFWTADAADRAKRHSELRMASQQFGLSPFSRRQLQWEVRRAEGAQTNDRSRSIRPGGAKVLSILEGRTG